MKRTIKIPNVNDGREFEVPKRKPKHRIKLYEKLIELEKDKPDLMKNSNYRSTMEGSYLALYVIQDKYPDATIDDILELEDDLEDKNNLTSLICIVSGTDYEKLKKDILSEEDAGNFRKPESKKKLITGEN